MAIDGAAPEPTDYAKTRARQSERSPRYPENSAWPAEMRVDMLAAYLDFRSVDEVVRAISKARAPAPTAFGFEADHES